MITRAELPEEFLDHLVRSGIPVPKLLSHPRVDPATRFRPFGWNGDAAELNRHHGRPTDHPDLAIIRKVNSRSFALALEQEITLGPHAGTVVQTPEELRSFLSRAPAGSRWVIKAEHGNAGLANRRLARPRLEAADLRFVGDRFAEDDRLVVEPWLARERDWCVVFDVPFDPDSFRVHETVCTADGALIGALFEPGRGAPAAWWDDLGKMAERVAARLDQEGYFGGVCVDAFAWREGDGTRLRPLVDLNCRLSMSDGAYRLWRRIAPDRTLFYRFFNRRKIDIPDDLPDTLAALGGHAYDRDSRRGILLASPLRLGAGDQSWRPGKLAFLFVADGRSGTFALERWFRDRFED